MISVTAYCNNSPLCFGRGETEAEARKNAELFVADIQRRLPRLSDPRMWEFKRDTCDRQMFQPARA